MCVFGEEEERVLPDEVELDDGAPCELFAAEVLG